MGVLEKVDLSENVTLDAEQLLKEMLQHLPPAKASRIAAKVLPGSRKDYYEMALSLLSEAFCCERVACRAVVYRIIMVP